MILYALAAAALAAAQPDPAAAPAAQPEAEDPAKTLAGLNDLYGQTCTVKAYASYDDICHALRDQIHDAEKAADKAAKEKAKARKLADKSKPAAPAADAQP